LAVVGNRNAELYVRELDLSMPSSIQSSYFAVFLFRPGAQVTSGRRPPLPLVPSRPGIGHWRAHEGRHAAVSIMSSNGVPIQEIGDTVGHKSTHVTETVYRHVIVRRSGAGPP